MEVASLGFFDNLELSDIKRIIIKIVEITPIDTDLNVLNKTDSIQQAITINQQKKKKRIKDAKGRIIAIVNIKNSSN